jgi:ferrochelatase
MTGVLVMAYGGPDSLDDVEPYIMDVRGHRPTAPEVIHEMRERYALIGGRSPILELTRAQASAIEAHLQDGGTPCNAYVGMRHWHPFIRDTLRDMREAGVQRAVGVVMAPHESRMSVGAYYGSVSEADSGIEVRGIRSWHLMPEYIGTIVELIDEGLERFPEAERHGVELILTAHSLPSRIVEQGDPYPVQMAETFGAVSRRLPGLRTHFAYQSAAMTREPWLGPDVGELLEDLARQGRERFLIAPVGFTCEHVEILYDIDVELKSLADRLGVRLERIEMMNDHPRMTGGLARLVREEIDRAGWS